MRQSEPTFNATKYEELSIKAPGFGGLNLEDLPYNLLINQSPNMVNMMISNGSFGKRYGQSYYCDPFVDSLGGSISGNILSLGIFNSLIFVHIGTKIYTVSGNVLTDTGVTVTAVVGSFFAFNKMLYFMNGHEYLEYNGTSLHTVTPYVPDICINRKPDGSYADLVENFNRLGNAFKNTFNGDGTSTVYKLNQVNLDTTIPIVQVGTTVLATTEYTVDYVNGSITFTTAPVAGTNNVVITAYKTEQEYIDSIVKCKYHSAFGGNNNSRLFIAGNGNSTLFYSDVFDATYFPESQYMTLGGQVGDITGFGEQYSTLVVFKANEVYGITYTYNTGSSTTTTDDKPVFSAYTINSRMGCDVPFSIQLIDNKLTWLHTVNGACVMVSTTIKDERNIQSISRNINGGTINQGLLTETNLKAATSIYYDGKYWIFINSKAYIWDVQNSPYSFTGYPDKDALKLSWFIFDSFKVDCAIIDQDDLIYAKDSRLCTLNNSFEDFGLKIEAHYQTPMMNFGLIDYLKTIKRMYVSVRADTATRIITTYKTEDNMDGEVDDEQIIIPGHLWNQFAYTTFGWTQINFSKTFAKRISIKKVQMLGVLFFNDTPFSDLSISALKFSWLPVKKVR